MNATYDAIIVGGGILGQAIAHELCRVGTLDCLHIYPAGYGRDCATTAAGAMISAFGEVTDSGSDPLADRKLAFRVQCQELYDDWLDSIRDASGAAIPVSRGIFMIANAHGSADRKNLFRLTAALDRFGRAYQRVAPADMPGFSPDAAYQPDEVVFLEDDFSIDSVQLLDALAGAVVRSDRGRVLNGWVRSVRQSADERWEVTTAEGGCYRAPKLILCTGAHLPELLGEDLLRRLDLPPLYFAKGIGFVVSGAPAVPHAIRTPNRSDACGVHIVPRAGGRLYIGASTHYGHAAAAARGPTPGEVTAILGDTLRQIDTRLRDATIEDIRFGLRPICGNGAPLIGRTALAGLSLATGTFRTGIVMAPLIARLVADELTGRESATPNPWPVHRDGEASDATNIALFHLNLGLRAYQDLRLHGDVHRRADALAHWQTYCAIAGSAADQRILDLMAMIDTSERSPQAATPDVVL
jgi:glycine oxidase